MKKKVFLSLLVIVALFITGCGKKNESRDLEVYENAFFIKSNNYYALFNDDGKQLTDFAFTSASNFINGAALVKTEQGPGVIGSNGKMIIPFGKYKSIYSEGGLYKAVDEAGNSYLFNAKGNKVADLKDVTVSSYIGVNNYLILLNNATGDYSVLNKDGEVFVSFKKVEDAEKPATNSEKGFASVFYNNKNYILDLLSNKKIVEFDADSHYCVNNASDDGKIITLNSCVGTFQKQNTVTYRVIKDGKLYDLSDSCDKVTYGVDYLICTKDKKNYLLDSNMNVSIATDSVSYTDTEHYAKAHNGSFNGIDFYEKDTVVTNVACRTMHDYGYSKSGFYILTTYYSRDCGTSSGSYEFYNNKGENVFNKTFASVQKFDANNLARVSEDRSNYYLIDTKGNKVSEEYASISYTNGYYAVKKDSLYGLLDASGKLVIETKYKNVSVFEENGKKYAKIMTEDNKCIIYNLESKKEIITFDTAPTTNANYMSVTKDGKKVYYTYTGKQFYEG